MAQLPSIPNTVTGMLAASAKAGADENDDVGRMVAAVGQAMMALDAHMTTLDQRPVADIERAVKQSLMGLRPAFERRWRWQTRIYLAVAFVAGASTACVSNYASYAIGSASGRHDVGIWQSWWQSTCTVGSSNRVVVAGKQVCQVPIEQKTAQ